MCFDESFRFPSSGDVTILDSTIKRSRRQVLRAAAGAAAALALPTLLPASALGRDGALAPSQRITLGAIGLGGRGTVVLRSFMANRDVQFTAICDTRRIRREAIKQWVIYNYGNFVFAADLVASGSLGKLHTVHANTLNPPTRHDWLPAEPEPPKDEVDWEAWLGPCPWRPYNSQYVARGWKGHFDFHGGGILEWGSHTVDLCQWAAQKDDTTPVEYIPEVSGVVCTYADGLKLVMRDSGWMGLGTCSVRYEGDEGWIETGDSGQFAIYPESLRTERTVFTMAGTDPSTHVRNFLDCVKTRRPANTNSDVAAQSHIVCHSAYIAWQLGRTLKYDPATHEFDDADANRMRSRAMREPYRI